MEKARLDYRILKEDNGDYRKLIALAMFSMGFSLGTVKADSNTIYVRADGSVDPPTAPILQGGETYTVMAHVTESIAIARVQRER